MSDRSWLVLNVKWCCLRVEWVCAKSPLPSFPLWLFPCPCSILLPCPRRGRVHFTPFFLFLPILRLLSSHIWHNSLYSPLTKSMLNCKWCLNWRIFSPLNIFCIFIHNICSYHYSYADYQNCSDFQRAGWQLGLIMMIILSKYDHDIEDRLAWLWWSANDNWLALGAALPTAPDQPYNQVHPLQNTILSTFKKYSTTLWDIFALNCVPLLVL